MNSDFIPPEEQLARHLLKVFLPDELFQFLATATKKRSDSFFAERDVENMPNKPSIEDYWSFDPLLHTPYLMNRASLPRDRFQIILRFLRFANYDEIDEITLMLFARSARF